MCDIPSMIQCNTLAWMCELRIFIDWIQLFCTKWVCIQLRRKRKRERNNIVDATHSVRCINGSDWEHHHSRFKSGDVIWRAICHAMPHAISTLFTANATSKLRPALLSLCLHTPFHIASKHVIDLLDWEVVQWNGVWICYIYRITVYMTLRY